MATPISEKGITRALLSLDAAPFKLLLSARAISMIGLESSYHAAVLVARIHLLRQRQDGSNGRTHVEPGSIGVIQALDML